MQSCRQVRCVYVLAFSVAASPAAAQTLSITSDAVAHWRLDEANGSRTATDSSGHGHAGVINAGLADPSFTTADKAPFPGNVGAMAFRLFDVVNAGDVPAFRFGPSDPMSLTVWVKQTQSQDIFHILGKRAGCSDDAFDYQIAGDPYLQVTATSARRVDTGRRLPLNTWTHIAVTYDGVRTLRIYEDGVEIKRSETFVLPLPSTAFFSIGTSGDCGFGQRFNGLIDDVRIYNRALSPAQIVEVIAGAGSGTLVGSYGGSITLSAVLGAASPAGKTIDFSVNGSFVGEAVTDSHGIATLEGVSLAGIEPGTYPAGVRGTFTGDASTAAAAATADLLVLRAVPALTIDPPPIVSAPYTFVSSDVHAAANVPGTFSFAPAPGTVLTWTQSIAVHFEPADSVHYVTADTTVTLHVGLGFQPQPVTMTTVHRSTFTNSTSAQILAGATLLSGPDASSYLAVNGCFNMTLAPGASCSIDVTFAPLRTGVIRADLELMTVSGASASVQTTSLYGEATGDAPAYAVPDFHATVLDATLPPGAFVGSLSGFNNHDQFTGTLFYPTGRWDGACGDFGGHFSSFLYANSTYLDLGTVPGSLLSGPDPCTGWGWPIGIDDAGNVIGVSDSADFPAGTVKYDGASMIFIRTGWDQSAYAVVNNGVVLFTDRSFFFNGQLQQPLLPPFPIVGPGGVVDYFFHTASLSWLPVQEIPRVYSFHDENAAGIAAGTVTYGPGDYTPALFQNGVATAFTGPGATSLNAAGQTVGDIGSGPIFWDRRTGMHVISQWLPADWTAGGQPLINDAGHILTFAFDPAGVWHVVLLTPVLATPTGSNVVVQSGSTTLTFSSVSSPGTTTVNPIDASTTGSVPGGFAISDTLAFQISTTASFSGPITIGFVVPGPMTEEDFNDLRVLHNENGTLVDVTSGDDYAHMTIYATTTSFSPFYVARRGDHILTLFDTSKAYKAGGTIPIKLQVLNAANANLSSAALTVKSHKLIRVQDGTAASVIDAGNANPDADFRFDPTLGGTGGYIFNLNTKRLKSGRYSLSLRVGSETAFVYAVTFEVK